MPDEPTEYNIAVSTVQGNLERRIEQAREALTAAVDTIQVLAEQQAMPDDSHLVPMKTVTDALTALDNAAPVRTDPAED